MLQGLQAILGMVGPLMVAPDADPGFLHGLMDAITKKVQEGTHQATEGKQMGPGGGGGPSGFGGPQGAMGPGAGGGGDPSGGMMGGMPGGPPGGGMPPGMPPGMGDGGGGGMPNPDELRRVLGATGATG